MGALTLGLIQAPLAGSAQQDAQKALAQAANDAPLLRGLAGYVLERWEEAQQARQAVLPRLQAAHRARSGEYSPSKLANIRQFGGSEVFLRIIANKSMVLLALLKDVYLGQTDKPWSLRSTPVPRMPAEVEQKVRDQLAQEIAGFFAQFGQLPDSESIRAAHADMQDAAEQRLQEMARKMAERMERKMADQLTEGGFEAALAEFLTDFVTFPTAIIKGPTLRRRPKMTWGVGPDGKTAPVVSQEIVPEFERVDPFRAYFAPGADSPQRGFFIELVAMQYDDLYDMIGSPGVNEGAVRAALSEADNGGLAVWPGTSTLSDTPDKDNISPTLKRDTFNIDAVLFYGPVKGRDLIEWGIEDPIEDPDASYEAAVWMVGKWVVKAHLNYDPLGVRPYFSASYCTIPGQAHGESVPDLLKDLAGDDGLMQVGARSLANNMAMACLTGDTVVYRDARHDNTANVTLDDLWKEKHNHNSGLRRNRLRSLDESTGEFFGNKVIDIVDNGVADVFLVKTTRGYSIKATGNHRFMREDMAWQELDAFSVGQLVAVNGGDVLPLVVNRPRDKSGKLLSNADCLDCGVPLRNYKSKRCQACAGKTRRVEKAKCLDCGVELANQGAMRCKPCSSQFHNSTWDQEQVARSRANVDVLDTTARARKDCRDAMKDFCQSCGVTSTQLGAKSAGLHVHHKDRNPANNLIENLETLCPTCHRDRHAKEDSFGNGRLHRFFAFDTIESITHVGKERVFDLCMEGPNHNFVANGFISHNSGPMVGINTDRLQQGEDISTLHPWQMFQLKNSEYGNQVDRPLEFYQPNMHAQELLAVLDKLDRYADTFSMIPRSAAGESPSGGVGRTASGLAMQLDAAGKGLKAAVMNVDTALAGLLTKLFAHNMQFDPDETLKNDAQVVARGATSLMQLESLRIRRNEAINTINSSPMAQQIVGIEGMGEILRTTLDDLDIDVARVIPSREKLAAMTAPQGQGQPPGGAPPEASQEVLPGTGGAVTDNFSPNPMTPQPGAAQGFAAGGLVSPEDEFAKNTTPGMQNATFEQFQANKIGDDLNRAMDDQQRFSSRWTNNPEQMADRFGDIKSRAGALAGALAPAGSPQQSRPAPAPTPEPAPTPPPPPPAKKRTTFKPIEPMAPLTELSTGLGLDPDPLGLS